MKDLLTRALEAHGGLSSWREIEAFQLKVSIGGGLWRLKGLPDGLREVTLPYPGSPADGHDVRGIEIPVAVSAFPDEIYTAPRSWAERAYPKLIHYNKAATSPPGSSRSSSAKKFARASGHCANRSDAIRVSSGRRKRPLRVMERRR